MPHFLVCACGHRWQWEAPDDAISSGIRDKVPAQTTEAEGQTITMNGGTPSAGPDDSTGIINPASLDLPEPPAEKDAGTVPTEPEKPVAPPPATAEMEPAASTEKIPPPVPSCPEEEEKWVKNQSAELDDYSAATVMLGEALPRRTRTQFI